MRVEVVYALRLQQEAVELALDEGTTVREAADRSGLLSGLASEVLAQISFAVWGRNVTPDFVLEEGDRLELLRPLQADPKETRRARARRKR